MSFFSYALIAVLGVFLLNVLAFGFFLLKRSLSLNIEYEKYINDIARDLYFEAEKLQNLLKRRQDMAVDPDVLEVYRIIEGVYNLLVMHAKKSKKQKLL